MANISEQCACVYVRGSYYLWGEKKSLSTITDCTFIVLASCLQSQDEIYPRCVSTVSKGRSRANKRCLLNNSRATAPEMHQRCMCPFPFLTRTWVPVGATHLHMCTHIHMALGLQTLLLFHAHQKCRALLPH